MTAISVGLLTEDDARAPRPPESENWIASNCRVGPPTIACDDPRSVFRFCRFTCGTRHACISPSKESERENTDGPDVA
jgi:hypothetical protein